MTLIGVRVSDHIIIQLDSVKKYRNKSEWRPVNRASTTYKDTYIEVVGDGHVILQILDRLYTFYNCPITAYVEVRRGEMPVFKSMPLNQWLFPEKQAIPEGLLQYQQSRRENKDD
jgi:hypothetical protein